MQKLLRLGNSIDVIFFYIVCIVALKNMISESYLTAIILIPILLILTYLYKHKHFILPNNEFILKYRIPLWYGLQLFSCILMTFLTIKLRVNYSWDWGQLISTASTKILTGEWTALEYYSQCANNQPWLLCLVIYFKFIQIIIPMASEKTFHIASIILSILFTQVTLLLLYKTARLLFTEKKALFVGITGLVCLPFYLYAQFAYTDTVSMMMAIFSLFIYLKLQKQQQINKIQTTLLLSLLIITAIFIFKIKILTFIVILAIILEKLLTCNNWKKFFPVFLICCIFFCVGNKSFTIFLKNMLPITDEMADQYEFSWTHYVMMGMNHYGGYSQDDVDFSKSAGNFKEKQKAELNELKQRITNYGPKGTLNHLFYTKLSRTWGNSCLAGDDYSHRYPYNEGSIWERLFGVGEDLHWTILIYTWLFHILMLIGIFIESIFSFKKNAENQGFMVLRYTLLGVGIFLTLWECNSRYLLPFLPFMIILSARGWEIFSHLKIEISK